MPKSDREKLELLLQHWIEHNEAHGHEFQEWAEKAGTFGEGAVQEEILNAVGRLQEANDHLRQAQEKLRERRST